MAVSSSGAAPGRWVRPVPGPGSTSRKVWVKAASTDGPARPRRTPGCSDCPVFEGARGKLMAECVLPEFAASVRCRTQSRVFCRSARLSRTAVAARYRAAPQVSVHIQRQVWRQGAAANRRCGHPGRGFAGVPPIAAAPVTMNAPTLSQPATPPARRPTPVHVGRISLATGGALLAAGCWLGATAPTDRAWSLTLLCASILPFAAACRFEVRGGAAVQAVMPGSPAPAGLGQAPAPAPAPAPPPAPALPRAGAAPDLATLMQAPLPDLLLAALCKDPQGARRMFAQALLHADADNVPATFLRARAAHAAAFERGTR